MITLFFNEEGYYITGNNVESTRRCSPALTIGGDRIFQPIHHTYKVLYQALCELQDMGSVSDVVVYNDSRIIDEINGTLQPLDEVCHEWIKLIHRHVIPGIRPLVMFRKRPVHDAISRAHGTLLVEMDEQRKRELAQQELTREEARKRKMVERLKKAWFGEQYGN